jgi:hypothetical protein
LNKGFLALFTFSTVKLGIILLVKPPNVNKNLTKFKK